MKALKVAAVAGLVVAGCVPTASIQSSRSINYKGPLKKLYVLSKAGHNGEIDHRSFEETFEGAVAKCGVDVQISTMEPLELNPHRHFKRVESYQPEALLLLRATSGTKQQDGTIVDVVYDAVLAPPQQEEELLWRGTIHLSPKLGLSNRGGEVLAKILVNQLAVDGIFQNCPSVTRPEDELIQRR